MSDVASPSETCWIVSPMLRDSESFEQLHHDVRRSCDAAGISRPLRFLVVDDSAGTDPDVSRLASLEAAEVLTPPFNLGHQRAIVYGLRALQPRLHPGNIVVTMDSDGEDMARDVPRLIHALDDPTTVLALAERTERSESLKFRVMYLLFRLFFRAVTGTTVRSGNFAAQRADSLAATIQHPSFDLCFSSTLLALKLPTVTVPCARGTRYAGRSRMNTYSLVAHGVRMLLPFSERIAVRTLVAAVSSAVALVVFLVLIGLQVFGEAPGPTVLSLLAALGTIFLSAFAAFVVLFSGFAQASAVATKGIGVPSPPAP